MAKDTRLALGDNAALCENRSLLLDRFTPAPSDKPAHRAFYDRLTGTPASTFKHRAWQELLLSDLPRVPGDVLFGQLQSRLLLNPATGFPDKPGLCLDSLSGIPFIPGSAVKGCARRYALQLLRQSPTFDDQVNRLVELALVFGWGDRPGQNDSDLAWACQTSAPAAWAAAQQQLQARCPSNQEAAPALAQKKQSRLSGQVHFLPAFPWESLTPDLELDVVYSHHAAYYRRVGSPFDAPDVEVPVPQFFPAVAPGHLFVFPFLGRADLRPLAKTWLQAGLAAFGLGARKSAGYGWFETSEALQQRWKVKLAQMQELEHKLRQQQSEDQARKDQAESERKAEEDLKRAMEILTPAQQEDFKLVRLTDDQFRSRLQNFARTLTPAEQLAVVRALRQDRLHFWEDLKQRARRGGQWAQAEQAIRAACKKGGLGKMP